MNIQMKLVILLLCMVQYVSSVVVDSANSGKRYHAPIPGVYTIYEEGAKCRDWTFVSSFVSRAVCGAHCDARSDCNTIAFERDPLEELRDGPYNNTGICWLCTTTPLDIIWSNEYDLYKVTQPLQPSHWEDAPIATQSELYTAWSSLTCGGGQTYSRVSGTCADGLICFENGDVLECPSGAVRLNETHCSTRKNDLYAHLPSSTGATDCITACSKGEYFTEGNVNTCTPCASGFQPNDNSVATSCTPWSITSCRSGQYLTANSDIADGSCTPCTSGYLVDQIGVPDLLVNASMCKQYADTTNWMNGHIKYTVTTSGAPDTLVNQAACQAYAVATYGKIWRGPTGLLGSTYPKGCIVKNQNVYYTTRGANSCLGSWGSKCVKYYNPNWQSEYTDANHPKGCIFLNNQNVYYNNGGSNDCSVNSNSHCVRYIVRDNKGFQPNDNSVATSCTPWQTCSAGEYYTVGTAFTDATCTTCTSGFQPNDNSVATSCTPWSITSCPTGEYLVTANSATADGVCESWDGKRRLASGYGVGSFTDAPIASPSELNTAWSSLTCVGGQTYQANDNDNCDVGKICFTNGDVLECPSGAVRLNETHCSSEKEVVHDASKAHCPL